MRIFDLYEKPLIIAKLLIQVGMDGICGRSMLTDDYWYVIVVLSKLSV